MDIVGPRYIKGDGRFYSMNVIDLYSHRVFIESYRTKEDDNIAQGLLHCWKSMGLPDFLQMDNELSFRGSNRYPRSLGLVLRLCLYFGIQPVFIPVAEPWRDGVIESFNDTYDKKFFRRQWFTSYSMLKRQSKNFQQFHNFSAGVEPVLTVTTTDEVPVNEVLKSRIISFLITVHYVDGRIATVRLTPVQLGTQGGFVYTELMVFNQIVSSSWKCGG